VVETETAHDAPIAVAGRPTWRRVTAIVLLVLGGLFVPLTVVAVWVRNQLLDTDRYVATMAPLASNPEIQDAAAKRVSGTLLSALDVEQLARASLPNRAQSLAAPIADAVRSFVLAHTRDVLASSQFQELWTRANRAAHEQVRALLTGDSKVVTSVDGKVELDLQPVLEDTRAALVARGLTVLERVDTSKLDVKLTMFETKALEKSQRGTRAVNAFALASPLLALGAFVGAVWLAYDRRRALIRVGFAIAIGAAMLSAGVAVARSLYLDALSGVVTSRDAAAEAYDTVVRNVLLADRLLIVAGLLIAIGAFLAGRARAAVAARGVFTRAAARAGTAAGVGPNPVTRRSLHCRSGTNHDRGHCCFSASWCSLPSPSSKHWRAPHARPTRSPRHAQRRDAPHTPASTRYGRGALTRCR
jgi:hypothetical protein